MKNDNTNERLVYDGFHKIIEFNSVIKDNIVTREKLVVKSAVAGIVLDEYNRIALVTQYRPTINLSTKEIPAGLLDKIGLTPLETLIEELNEECEISNLDILSFSEFPIHDYYMIAGSSDAKISLYEIHVKNQENKIVSDCEVESIEWVDLLTMNNYIKNGLISDGKTILAYYYLKDKFNNCSISLETK